MQKKVNKTVERAKNMLQKRIDVLSKKIETVKDRYPEDMYGCRWMMKASAYEAEQEYLGNFISKLSLVERGLDIDAQRQRTVFEQKKLLVEIMETLVSYGEGRLADRLRKQIEMYDNQI